MGYTPLHFTEEERIFRDQMYRFADQEIAPIADEIDHNDRFPEEIIPKFGRKNLILKKSQIIMLTEISTSIFKGNSKIRFSKKFQHRVIKGI